MSFFSNRKQSDDYHVFSTDNSFMKQLGLSTFTTGILYDWWYKKGYKGEYINRKFVSDTSLSSDFVANQPAPQVFFGCQEDVTCPAWQRGFADAVFQPWRFHVENNSKGRYEIQTIDTWSFEDAHKSTRKPLANPAYTATPFIIDDIFFTDYYGVRFRQNPDVPEFGHDFPSLLSAPEFGGKTDVNDDYGLSYISTLIAFNDYIVWKKNDAPQLGDWEAKDIALLELLDDIKTSKSGCLNIPVQVEFDLAPNQLVVDKEGNPTTCFKKEKFTINLFLYDNAVTRDHKPTAITTSTKHAGVPITAAGQPYANKVDGELSTPDPRKPSDKIAADIDLFYNEFTNKWSSGGKNVLAKVTAEVTPAEIPHIDALEQGDIEENLLNPDDDAYYGMGSGLAVPVSMQNGNPYQWAPNYLSPKECRNDNRDKAVLEVTNPSTRIFKRNETVLLHEVDGRWFPMPYASGDPVKLTVGPVVQGKWEFMQFATDVRHFFQGWAVDGETGKDRDGEYPPAPYSKISPIQAEQNFHGEYYKDDELNKFTFGFWNPDPEKLQYPIQAPYGFDQMTSFDFMNIEIGGLRGDKRAYANTVWGLDGLNGNTTKYLDDDLSPRGNQSLFWGCVFPDGYSQPASGVIGTNPVDFTDERTYDVKAHQPLAGYPSINYGDATGGDATGGDDDTGSNAFRYFRPAIGASGLEPQETKSYFDGIAIYKDEIPMLDRLDSDKTALREGPKVLEPQSKWFGIIPPMFAATDAGDYTMRHLPADIALNASPAGENGAPLTNMHLYKYIHMYEGWMNANEHDHYAPTEVKTESKWQVFIHEKPLLFKDINIGGTQQDFFREVFFSYRYNWLFKSEFFSAPGGVGGGGGTGDGDDEGSEPDPPKDKFNIYDSAMDLKPVRNSRIQFRPLKYEVYSNMIDTQWGLGNNWDEVPGQNTTWWEYFLHDDNPARETHPNTLGSDSLDKPQTDNREMLWYYLNRHVMSDEANARGLTAINREANGNFFYDGGGRIDVPDVRYYSTANSPLPRRKNPLYVDGIINHWNEVPESFQWEKVNAYGAGLASNVDIDQDYFRKFNSSSRFGDGSTEGPFTYDMDDTNWWHFQTDSRPAGAVGVIGAICTIGADSSIGFTTANRIGMQSIYGRQVPYPGSKFGQGNQAIWLPMWGGSYLKYDDFQMTDLSVRIYHAWPREQTIYDPRFFSVHHFNPGTTLPNDLNKPNHIASIENVGIAQVLATKINGEDPDEVAMDSDNDGVSDILVPVLRTEVDMRVPSYVSVASDENPGATLTRRPQSIPIDYFVYKNAVGNASAFDEDGHDTGLYRTLKQDFWNLDCSRRGKLLPYNYKKITVGLPFLKGGSSIFGGDISSLKLFESGFGIYRHRDLLAPDDSDPGVNNQIPIIPEEGIFVEQTTMIVQALGSGYAPYDDNGVGGDTFTFSNMTGAEFVVAATGHDGCVTELAVRDQGYDLDTAKVYNSGTIITRKTNGSVRSTYTGGSKGRGFGAYITKGRSTEKGLTDAKPLIATESDYYQIGAPSDNSAGGKGNNFFGSQFIAILETGVTTSADIKYPQEIGLYDCFFHFHNDVTHTWFSDSESARFSQYTVAQDQHITLDITPV